MKEGLEDTQQAIINAARRAGRDPSEVTLVAVGKTKPASMIRELYDLGVRDFGENKVQELTAKYEELPKDIRWHMIGHLQSNKVKYIVDKVAMIHSVDSLRLAQVIEKEAVKKDVDHIDVLLEVNVSGEESKYGMTPAEVEEQIDQFLDLKRVRIRGFMTVAPFAEDPEEVRPYFKRLKQLSVDIQNKTIDNNIDVGLLSMGMSGDFEAAIEEGASFVRVGTRIFGARNYAL
ncbi:MAG: YggS family pyridoxal phosphate-dependent enzyme [Lachnospiraceae bacterium]|nr:YggS family pyridoxal phosphate-dependent enzyme [Lachnospiraceae bacterium]